MAFERVNLVIIATFITLGTLAWQATSRSLFEASIAEKHEQWMEKYGRIYPDSAEKERRFAIFMKNVEFVEKSNNEGNKTYKLSINKFSDITNEEFIRQHTGYKIPTSSNSTLSENKSFRYQSLAATEVPASMDWKEKGAVTGIKDRSDMVHTNASKLIQSFNVKLLRQEMSPTKVSENELLRSLSLG